VDKRPQLKVARRVDQVNAAWRCERQFAVLGAVVVGREKSRKHRSQVNSGQHRKENKCAPSSDHRYTGRTRGSFQYRSASAATLPATRKTEESITAAITTWVSLASMASRTNGPSPGQFRITSTRNDMLSKLPM